MYFFVVIAGPCSVPGIKGLYSDPKYNYGVNEGMSPAMFLACLVRQNCEKRTPTLSRLSMPWSEQGKFVLKIQFTLFLV